MPTTVGAVIVAAGSGTRMRGADKLFTEVGGRPLLAHAIAAFQDCSAIDPIVLVLSHQNLDRGRDLIKRLTYAKVTAVVPGGARRQDSVRLGLEALGACEYVAVHDGGRPLVAPGLIGRGIEAVRETGAAVPAIPLADTVKEAGPDGIVLRTLDRSRLWAVQTPQVFLYELLLRAHREITADATDDASMVEALGEPVSIFEGSRTNLKVTTAEDLELVSALLAARIALSGSQRAPIYHIATRADWERSKSTGWYRGDTLDAEGFIHCSAVHQVLAVANSLFRGRGDLALLCIDDSKLNSELRWEHSEGTVFPHVYGPLNTDAVITAFEFKAGDDGTFELPAQAASIT
jgi:2-C-methyl-D-erythritol 4-phosphate cytidylyltransferase